jgi:uncharacterized protein GlcG (DUF336 family)
MNSTDNSTNQVNISWSAAIRLIEAGVKYASAEGHLMTIAITDASGLLKAFCRMDGSPVLSTQLAQDKAWTAAAYGIPTDQWFEFIKNDPPLLNGIVHTPRLVVFGGGLPIELDGKTIGGIGVSGGHYTQDAMVASEALKAL